MHTTEAFRVAPLLGQCYCRLQSELSDHITNRWGRDASHSLKAACRTCPSTCCFFASRWAYSEPAAGAAATEANRHRTPPAPRPHSGGLEEIVVTATRREEGISKVPISITAMSQDMLDQKGIRDITELVRFTPGVSIDTSGTNQISIRGISSSAGAGTTGIYIDDTPIQMRELGFNPDETLPKTFDLDRVEVLRGPQGTLFGSGSEGGTIRYIMTQPSVSQESTYMRSEASYTEYGAAERRGRHRARRTDHRRRARLSREHLVPLRRRLDQPRRQRGQRHRAECELRGHHRRALRAALAAERQREAHPERHVPEQAAARPLDLLAGLLRSGRRALQQRDARAHPDSATSTTCRRSSCRSTSRT